MSANERDELGEDLPPDYISSVRSGGFYGWPWFYIGNHPDPRHKGKHPELADKVIVPDVLVQAHSAGKVWGRPVGITISKDGSLLFSEDGNGTIWRVSYGR